MRKGIGKVDEESETAFKPKLDCMPASGSIYTIIMQLKSYNELHFRIDYYCENCILMSQ